MTVSEPATPGRSSRPPHVQHPLRWPVEFRDAMRAIADTNHRSVNAQILVAIEEHIRRHNVTQAPRADLRFTPEG